MISAPFLAIAVYYLLQVIATNVAEPVLVVVSFATGFISDSIVTVITDFASGMIRKKDAGKEQAARDQAAKDQAAKDQAATGQAAKDQVAKEQAAKAAKEQAAKAKDE